MSRWNVPYREYEKTSMYYIVFINYLLSIAARAKIIPKCSTKGQSMIRHLCQILFSQAAMPVIRLRGMVKRKAVDTYSLCVL